ncbi:MAG: hypothetical protein P8179_16735 [Candidatus Thiodiazotropha sp.]
MLYPRDFLISKSDALLKPYFFTLLMLLVGATLFSRGANIGEAVGILFGTGQTIRWTPLWFLPHLWCLLICSYVLVRLVDLDKRSVLFKVALLLILLFVGVSILALIRQTTVSFSGRDFELIGLPFSFDIVFISMAFLLSGYLMSQQVKNFTPSYPVLAIAIITFAYIVVVTHAVVDLNRRVYDQPIYATLAAISGIYFMLCIAFYVSRSLSLRRIFSTFGSASLFVLIFHYALGKKAQVMLGYMIPIEKWALLCGGISYVFSVTAPLLIRAMILKIKFFKFFYFPIKRSGLVS